MQGARRVASETAETSRSLASPQTGPTTVFQRVEGELLFRLKTRQALTFIALTVIAGICWYFLIAAESTMRVMRGDGLFMEFIWMMMQPGETIRYLSATASMWIVMMIAMMVPAVIPMLIVFRRLDHDTNSELNTFLFASGYLLAWCTFSLLAAVLQWQLHSAGWLRGELLSFQPLLAASVLITAGLYQLTPMKEACLDKCRSPMGFFLANWRDGRWGAVSMGLRHGYFCIACCWMLMLIMFVGGAMSVMTMALLSVFILVERVLPAGPWVARLPGAGLIAWGGYLAVFA